jgi:hypothetical protein
VLCSCWQVNPPPSKKTKPNTSSSNKDEDPSWVLDKNRLIKVREYKGRVYVDIRQYYESDGDLKPGKKGGFAGQSQILDLKCMALHMPVSFMSCFDITVMNKLLKVKLSMVLN